MKEEIKIRMPVNLLEGVVLMRYKWKEDACVDPAM